MVYLAVRVRGTVNIKPDIKHTLDLLNLTKVNHCVILPENDSTKGMLQIVKDYITWGEVDKNVLLKLISTRGKIQGDKNLTDEELAQVVAPYDGEIAFVDYALGQLFAYLKKMGLYDSSLIVVMGDHGEGFLEHGLMNHGNSVYDELLRVPLIFRFPDGRFGGKRVQEPVQLVDITPTILEVTGAGELNRANRC